ncbi:MAG: PDZ domain-containing protein [Planctomycetota bacterium]
MLLMISPSTVKALATTSLVALMAVVCSPKIGADDNESPKRVSYTVDLTHAANHYVTITMSGVATAEETEVMMPVWTPGSYLIREYARHIDSMSVTDADGNAIPYRKTRKNRWTLDTKAGQAYRIQYRVYCNEVSVRTNFANHHFAVLNGAATFITPIEQMGQPHDVRLTLPEGWRRSASSLVSQEPHRYTAADFDELVDSPIIAGQLEVFPFEVDGVPHQLVQVGDGAGYWDGTKAAADLQKIVASQAELWRQIPYDRYLFLNVIAEGRGGLEHDKNCLMLTSRYSYRDPKAYDDWLSLASHELFHAWNVRRLRPAPLRTYDYERETYTDSLWIAEGVTSYFEDVFLVRAGLIDEKEFLKRFSSSISRVETANGRRIQSLRDASYDTWIKFYRPDENSSNTRVSYYSKGAVVALLLDAKIQAETNGKRSLQNVLRKLYDEKLETGYTEDEFRNAASEIAGVDLTDWFTDAVDSTKPLDYDAMLQWYGLQFGAEDKDAEDKDAEDKDNEGEASSSDQQPKGEAEPKTQTPWLGVTLQDATVSKLQEDSPAFDAGFNTGDELLAINGFRLRASLASHLKQFRVGDKIEVVLDRKGELITRIATLGEEPTQSWELRARKASTEEQSTRRSKWLGTKPEPSESAGADSSVASELSANGRD